MPADELAQRECARGPGCVNRTPAGPALVPRAFCDDDADHIGACLKWLPDAYVHLYARLSERRSGAGGRVSGSRGYSVTVNLAFDEAMNEILHVLTSWEERVRDVARLNVIATGTGRRQRDGVALTRIVTTLRGHRDALLALPPAPMTRRMSIADAHLLPPATPIRWHVDAGYAEAIIDLDGADAGNEVIWLHRRVRRALGLTPRHRHLVVPCWNCDMFEVWQRDGAAGLEDDARCRHCGQTYGGDRYRDLLAQFDTAQAVHAARAGFDAAHRHRDAS